MNGTSAAAGGAVSDAGRRIRAASAMPSSTRRRSRRGTGCGTRCRRTGGANPAAGASIFQRANEIGNGTHWLPRSASYSTSTRRPPGARIARIAASTGRVSRTKWRLLAARTPSNGPAGQPRREVARARLDGGRAETAGRGAPRAAEGLAVAIHGDDRRGRTEDVGERERERPVARAELQPARAGARNPVADQRDVIDMVHLGGRAPPAPTSG